MWTKLVCHHFVVPFSSWSRAIFLSFSVIKSYFPKKQLLPIIFIFTKSALRSICHMSKCATWNLELSPPAFLKGIRLSRRWLHTFYSSEGSHEKGAMTKTLDALKQPSCYVPCLLWLVTFPLLPIAFKIVLWFYDVRVLCPAKLINPDQLSVPSNERLHILWRVFWSQYHSWFEKEREF